MNCAEVVSIGTELLLGQIVDTNAAAISGLLPQWGISVFRRSTVGDNLERIVVALSDAFLRCDIVITTGGLGPTMDDLTREGIAALWNLEMEEDPAVVERLERFFSQRGYPMPASNRKQALKPEGAVLIENRMGTAPGLLVEREGKVFIALPGPPFEMEPMLPAVHRLLAERGYADREIISSRVLHTAGIGESSLEDALHDLIASQTNPTIAPLAGPTGVDLRLTARAAGAEEARSMLDEMEKRVREVVGAHIYGVDSESREKVLARFFEEKGLTLSLAESCTGGLVSSLITDVPGASQFFSGSIVSYSNKAKSDLLGVDQALIEKFGAVSPECASAMAEGARRRFQTDIALSLTGIAGPGGGSPDKPVGTVYIALAHSGGVITTDGRFGGGRKQNKQRFSMLALDLLRRYLMDDLPE